MNSRGRRTQERAARRREDKRIRREREALQRSYRSKRKKDR
jgi:hypothetical protein